MIFFRNRLVFGIFKKVLSSIFKALYTIIKVLNLQIFLLVAVVGGIVFLTGGFSGSEALKLVFYFLAGSSIVYALVVTFKNLFGLGKKKEKDKNTVEEVEPSEEENKPEQNRQEDLFEGRQRIEPSQPKYFRVKDRKDLIMAEYCDRVELYRLENGKMTKIRTDYKTER